MSSSVMHGRDPRNPCDEGEHGGRHTRVRRARGPGRIRDHGHHYGPVRHGRHIGCRGRKGVRPGLRSHARCLWLCLKSGCRDYDRRGLSQASSCPATSRRSRSTGCGYRNVQMTAQALRHRADCCGAGLTAPVLRVQALTSCSCYGCYARLKDCGCRCSAGLTAPVLREQASKSCSCYGCCARLKDCDRHCSAGLTEQVSRQNESSRWSANCCWGGSTNCCARNLSCWGVSMSRRNESLRRMMNVNLRSAMKMKSEMKNARRGVSHRKKMNGSLNALSAERRPPPGPSLWQQPKLPLQGGC